jgi:hypothetical protein
MRQTKYNGTSGIPFARSQKGQPASQPASQPVSQPASQHKLVAPARGPSSLDLAGCGCGDLQGCSVGI